MTKKVLTIAGSDTWGGGGITTDIKTFENFGVFGLNALTSIAVKKEQDFQLVPLSSSLLAAQLLTIEDTFPLASVKLGYLGSVENIAEVKHFLQKYHGAFPVVCDPVLAFKETDTPLAKAYLHALEDLFPLVDVLTPNFAEAKLLGQTNEELSLEELASKLFEKYDIPVFVKGGTRLKGKEALDVLVTSSETLKLSQPRSLNATVNGAGCSLSAAIASLLALGFSLEKSVKISKTYVKEAIDSGVDILTAGNVWHQGKEANFYEK